MARTEVYINGKLADFNELDLSFVYSVEDDDTLSVSGSHSKRSIKLPATKRNNDIFSNAILLQQPQNLNAGLLSLPARIIVDGIPVFIGSAQIDKAGITKLSSYYEVLFLADNSDWIEQMRDVGMDTIDMDWDIDYTASNVMGSYIANATSRDGGFTFFLPKTAKWQKVKQVQVDELYPAIFVEWIFYKAFNNIGYTIQSNFFNTEFFRKLIIPVLARNYDTKALKKAITCKLSAPVMGPVSSTFLNFSFINFNAKIDSGLQTEQVTIGTSQYTVFHARVNGKYRFRGSMVPTNITPNGSFYISVGGATGNKFAGYSNDVTVEMVLGDTAVFQVPTGVGGLIVSGTMDVEYIGAISSVSNVPNITIGSYGAFNAYYNLSLLAKNWKILDVIADIQKIFNLGFVTDINKKEVTIEPRDYWIAGNRTGNPSNGNGLYTENLDVTQKIDVSKEIKQEYNPDAERYLIFNYKDDDPTCKAFEEDREDVKLYSHKFDRGARFKNEEKEIKLDFFNKCLHIEDSEIWGDPNFNKLRRFQLPLLFSENWYNRANPDFPDYNNQRPYLLYYYGAYVVPSYGETSMPIVYYDKLTNYTWNQLPVVPLAFMNYYNDYNLPAFTTKIPNLSFAKEDKGHGLITDFHNRDLERKAQNVNVEAYLNWSNMDIFQLDFKRKYILNGVQTILKTIDGYNPATKTTTKTVFQVDTRLLKDEDGYTNTEGIDSDLKGLIVI